MPRKPRVSCVRIGALVRAIDSMEWLADADLVRKNEDMNELRDILLETAEDLMRKGARLIDINAQLDDADFHFVRNRDENDVSLLTLRYDE